MDTKKSDSVVLIPTYNEKENISKIIEAVLGLGHQFDILVIDDNSPDGTAAIVEDIMTREQQVHILKRPGKQGLGTAYIAGFKWAIEQKYDYIIEMDADFSHNPNDLIPLRAACADEGADVSIG